VPDPPFSNGERAAKLDAGSNLGIDMTRQTLGLDVFLHLQQRADVVIE
jgi:hypothetical protein